MAVPLKAGPMTWSQAQFGFGPGNDAGAPIYTATGLYTWPGDSQANLENTIKALITAAAVYDITLFIQLSGNRFDWCDNMGGGIIHFNQSKYETNVRKYQNIPEVAAAFTSRRFIAYVVDEPQLSTFDGTLTVNNWAPVNWMAGLYKSIWSDCVTTIRVDSDTAPVGLTNVDYLWSQYEGPSHVPSGGETPAQFYPAQKALALAKGYKGIIPGFNLLDGGSSSSSWDYLNNGSSNGKIAGSFVQGGVVHPGDLVPAGSEAGNTRWMIEPLTIRAIADVVWNDPDYGGLAFWRDPWSDTTYQVFRQYVGRSDYVSALEYMLGKFNARSTWNGWLGELAPPPPTGSMGYAASAPVTTRQTTTSATYVDVTGAVVLASALVEGAQYLILVNGQMDHGEVNTGGSVRLIHGATAFDSTEVTIEPQSTNQRFAWFKWVLWTAAAGEDLKVQIKSEGGFTTGINYVSIVALKIDDLVQNTDWFYNANDTPTGAIGTTPVNGASVTFTPTESGDWLILSDARYTTPSATVGTISRIVRSGEAASTTPEGRQEGEDATNDIMGLAHARVFSVSALANTFKEQSVATSGTTGSRTHSRIFALNITKFAARGWVYTDAELDPPSSSPYSNQIQTCSITPLIQGPVVILGSATFANNQLGVSCNCRLQVDNTDSPTGQTGTGYPLNTTADAADYTPLHILTLPTLTNVAHAIDMDAGLTPGAGRGFKYRGIVAFSLALSAPDPVGGGGGGDGSVIPRRQKRRVAAVFSHLKVRMH